MRDSGDSKISVISEELSLFEPLISGTTALSGLQRSYQRGSGLRTLDSLASSRKDL